MPVIVKSQPQIQTEVQTQATAAAANPFQSKEERGKALRQVVAAFIANLGTINTGLVFGFSAVVIPQLKREDSLIQINESQASWIGKCVLFWSRDKYVMNWHMCHDHSQPLRLHQRYSHSIDGEKTTTTKWFEKKNIVINQNVVYTLRPIEKMATKSLEVG